MAKTKMLCPFSSRLCQECASYRGRHYLLCYSRAYRGHLGGTGGGFKPNANDKWAMPEITVSHDIFDEPQKDIG